jgi:hypothetical protein
MDAKYAAICGITEEELATDMAPDIAMLAEEYECTPEEMHDKLKKQYDGYRFAKKSPDIYNPFSLLKCFNQRDIANYWFESGTPTFLIRQMQHFRTDITAMDRIEEPSDAFDRPTEANCAGGRTDVVVEMPDTTYVFELKANGTAQEALDQINTKGYAQPYETEGRKVVKVGVAFERETMTVGEWVVG